MNEIQTAWNSSRNDLSESDRQRLAAQFSRQMIRRRRFQGLWLINTFVWLTLITGLATWNLLTGQTRPTQEWGLLPLLLLPWGFALHFLHRYLRPVPSMTKGETAIRQSLQAALASNRDTRIQTKWIGALYLLMAPQVTFAVRQLVNAGKVSPREMTSMIWFFGIIFLVGGLVLVGRYFLQLQPQHRHLDALLAELADGK